MDTQQFSLGVTYWPRRRRSAEGTLNTWGEIDQGALCAELEHIADLGCTTVRLELRWADVLPGTRVNTAALRGLERALDYAHDRGLRAVIALLGGSLGGALHLPPWAVGYRLPGDITQARRLGPPVMIVSADQPAILAGDRYMREPARDLFGEPEILEAQRLVLREVIGNLGAHPAATVWQLGADLERVRRPASARVIANWWADLVQRARDHGARACVGSVSPLNLGRRESLRPTAIASACQVTVSATPLYSLGLGETARAASFLHALVAGLLSAETGHSISVTVGEVGMPTATGGASGLVSGERFGRPASIALAEEDQQATLIEEALASLHREGAAGVWLAHYADISPELWHIAPADRSWWARSAGLVAPDGREKPAAAAVRTFAARLRAGKLPASAGPPTLPLDPERYWRDPATELWKLWADWQRT